MRDVVHRIRIPTLLIYCQKDLVVPVEVGQIIYNEIAEQNKELLILENSRHGAEDNDVLIFQEAIKKFYSQISILIDIM